MPMETVITTKALSKIYKVGFMMREVQGLKSLDLTVNKGEVFGFIGPNGAGKTTTIKILMGLQSPTSGHATVLGEPVTSPNSRGRVGFLPERPYFYEHLTARELLGFYGQLYDMPKSKRDSEIGELLERVELVRFADIPLKKYSKGMLQRVGLCQALLNDPDLVVLDEPMSGLDPLGRALVREVIQQERELGKTVFFSSHILHDVETLCDRVGIIVRGELRGIGTVDELVSSTARHIECRISGVEVDGLPCQPAFSKDGVHVVKVADADLNQFLAEVVQNEGAVHQVLPVRESLETILLDEVERAEMVNVKHMGVL